MEALQLHSPAEVAELLSVCDGLEGLWAPNMSVRVQMSVYCTSVHILYNMCVKIVCLCAQGPV